MNALISIVTPCFNASKYIEACVESVKQQTYTNWEMIIIDDCSNDNSVEVIESLIKYNSDFNIKLLKNKANSGPAKSRNEGIKISKGSYLTFIDADDLWDESFLETMTQTIQQSFGFVFASYRRCDEFSLQPIYSDFIVPEKVNYLDILKTNSISCLTAFIDIEKLGKELMPNVRYRQDMGLWLKYLKQIPYAVGVKQVLATYRICSNSHSRKKSKLLVPQWYFYRKVENLSVVFSIYLVIIWAYRGFLKYY